MTDSVECDQFTSCYDERLYHCKVLNTFRSYYEQCKRAVNEKRKWYLRMSAERRKMIPKYGEQLTQICRCLESNQVVLDKISNSAGTMFVNEEIATESEEMERLGLAKASDVNQLCSVLRHFVRDWSVFGVSERDRCYRPVLSVAKNLFPDDRSNVRVLVPGAGLGRLAWEFALAGFCCEGNEQSLYMLICCNYVLNVCKSAESFILYPWVNQWSNNRTYDAQTTGIRVPDVNPNVQAMDGRFSMSAGCFLSAYGDQQCCWDLIATVFFLDTAHNIIDYIAAIYRLLKPGAYWINLGPLLYHFSEMPGEESLELPLEEVINVIEQTGFSIVQRRPEVPTTYTANPLSMLYYAYSCCFLVCQKMAVSPDTEHPVPTTSSSSN